MCIVTLAMVIGCTVNVSVNNESETDMGSHHVVIKPGSTLTSSSSVTFGDDEKYEFTCGDITVKIENEELIVNEKNYGKLEAGQSIKIDHGTVFVADQERTPVKQE